MEKDNNDLFEALKISLRESVEELYISHMHYAVLILKALQLTTATGTTAEVLPQRSHLVGQIKYSK